MSANDLTGTVGGMIDGEPSDNHAADVKLVKELLNLRAHQIALKEPLTPSDRTVGPKTVNAITSFQQLVMHKAPPYGRVVPMSQGGTTLKALLEPLQKGPKVITPSGKPVPFFTQFDPKWGSHTLGNKKSLSKAGCAITSIAMVLKSFGRDIDPGKLDQYLDAHHGYVGDSVIWATAFNAGKTIGSRRLVLTNHAFKTVTRFATVLNERIDHNLPTIAHVSYVNRHHSKGDHYVVVVGRNSKGHFIINDPGTSQGNGAAYPNQQITTLGESTRNGGLNPVDLVLFDVA